MMSWCSSPPFSTPYGVVRSRRKTEEKGKPRGDPIRPLIPKAVRLPTHAYELQTPPSQNSIMPGKSRIMPVTDPSPTIMSVAKGLAFLQLSGWQLEMLVARGCDDKAWNVAPTSEAVTIHP
jgi:hypothetical protein